MDAFYALSLNGGLEVPTISGNRSSGVEPMTWNDDWCTSKKVEPPSRWAKILKLFLKEEEDVVGKFDLDTFLEECEKIALQGENKVVEKKRKPKKSVKWFDEVYKMETPVSSCVTYDPLDPAI